MSKNGGSWLTAKRLRAHGLVFALALWSIYVWTLATPGLRDRNGNLKGTDFLHLYTLGSLALEHRGADLYDMKAQADLAAERVPEAAGIKYLPLYPPQVSVFFAPLASLPYGWALAIWWIFSAGVYALCCYGIWRACPNLHEHGVTVATVAVGYPAFFHLIAWGQTSAVALACFSAMFLLMRARRDFLAGIALGCLIFKPQLGLAAAVVFVAAGTWRVVAGAVLSAAIELGVGVLYYGIRPLRRWIEVLWSVPSSMPWLEPKPYQTHCLRTFWSMLVPWHVEAVGPYVMSALVVLAFAIAIWKNADSLPLRYSALLLTTVLVAPHLTVYDLVILAPAILLLADWLVEHTDKARHAGPLVYAIYALPLIGPLARYTHVQLSVIAMGALLCVIWKTCASDTQLQYGRSE